MEIVTAVFQAICLFLGYSDDKTNFMNDCMKTHTKQECQQLWRDK